MKLIIVSDIHINSYFSKEEKFLNLMSKIECDVLVINGDLYDLYVGPPQKDVHKILKQNRNIKEIVYIRGNHDFHINDYLQGHSEKSSRLEVLDFYEVGENLFGLVKSVTYLALNIFAFPLMLGALSVESIIKTVDRSYRIIRSMNKGCNAESNKELLFNCLKISKDAFCMLAIAFSYQEITLAYFGFSIVVHGIKIVSNLKKQKYWNPHH